MKKKKIAIIISVVLVLLAAVTLIYIKVLLPKKDSHAKQGMVGMAGMENMDMSGKDSGMNESDSAKKLYISLHTTLLPTDGYAISSIPAVTLTKSIQPIEINAIGYTVYNTNEVGAISAWISGRIEKLYIRYRYQAVKKGQKIMDIYSPELLTAQQNLLFLLKNDPSNTSFINAAKQRLLLLGFPTEQLQQVINTQKPLYTVSVYSRYGGHIHEALGQMNNAAPQASAINDEMSTITQELSLKEGMYLQKGQTVFEVYNPDKVWALLNIYPSDLPFIKVGNKVNIKPETGTDKNLWGTIYFIEPFFRPGSKTLTARVNIDNSILNLAIGSQLRATIYCSPINAEWLPKEAVISLGLEKVVFVKQANGFKAQKLATGITYKNLIQVKDGIKSTDSVAINAQFLMDSESFIKVNKND